MILKLGKRFLCFFDMSLQKNVKVTFLDFEKKEKNVFSNYEPNPCPSLETSAAKELDRRSYKQFTHSHA